MSAEANYKQLVHELKDRVDFFLAVKKDHDKDIVEFLHKLPGLFDLGLAAISEQSGDSADARIIRSKLDQSKKVNKELKDEMTALRDLIVKTLTTEFQSINKLTQTIAQDSESEETTQQTKEITAATQRIAKTILQQFGS